MMEGVINGPGHSILTSQSVLESVEEKKSKSSNSAG